MNLPRPVADDHRLATCALRTRGDQQSGTSPARTTTAEPPTELSPSQLNPTHRPQSAWLDDNTVALLMCGEIDVLTAPLLLHELTPLLATARVIVLDFSQVTFLGLEGIAALLELRRRADAACVALRLVVGPHCVAHSLRVTGVGPQLENCFGVADIRSN